MAISFNGLSSGIDTAAIIEATLSAHRFPINQLETKKSGFDTQISTLGKIASKLDELKKLAKEMGQTSNVLAYTLSASDEAVIAASADGEASAGSYDISVTQLARAEKDRSAAFAGDLAPVKAGTLTLQTAGDTSGPHLITIAEGDSLDTVVGKINASGARVEASIVRDGTSSYLQIVASDSGHVIGGVAADAITISESYSGAAGGELGLTQVTQAQNALLSVDGLAAESRDNRTGSLIPGVALELKKVGVASVGVAPDKAGTRGRIEAFVLLANDLGDMLRSATRTTEGGRRVEPDPTVERLATELRRVMLDTVSGVPNTTSSLARIGIQSDSSGKLVIDSTKFDKALDADLRGVGRLFTQQDTGIADKIDLLMTRYTDAVGGPIANRRKALNERIDQLDSQINRMETRLDKLGTTLMRQFTAMEQALASYQAQGAALTSLYA